MTNEQIDSLKKLLAEHTQDIESLGLTDCQVLWSLKNGDGKIAAYSVLVVVPDREDNTTNAICEKHQKKIQFQIEQEVHQQAGQSAEYYNHLLDLELEVENLSDKIVELRMQELYATLIQERSPQLLEAPFKSRSDADQDDGQEACVH